MIYNWEIVLLLWVCGCFDCFRACACMCACVYDIVFALRQDFFSVLTALCKDYRGYFSLQHTDADKGAPF